MARGAATVTVKITGDAKGLKDAFSDAEGALGKFGGGLGKLAGIAGKAAAATAAAVTGIAVASIKAFSDFDAKMTESVAIMGDVSATMREDMSDAAREIAKTTKFSADQAAESYFFLASAGMDAQQSMAALPQVAAFAQAGMFDMATATDLATDAQSALGLKSENVAENLANLTRVTDVFVKANVLANTSVEQVAEALTNKAGAALRSVNKEIEEGAAVLAAFADQGTKGRIAGERLSIMLRDLATFGAENAEAFANFGIEVFDAEGNLRNMADIVGEFEVALADMSDEQKAVTFRQLGLTEASADAVKQLLGTSDAIREYERELRNAGGTTQDVADKQMETFSAQMGLVWSQIKDVAISIGSALVPALQQFVDWLQQRLPDVTGWFETVAEKFNETLGVTEDTTDEMQEALTGFDVHLSDVMGKNARQSLHGFDIMLADQAGKTGEKMDTIGQMLSRVREAWDRIWVEDIQPWFNNVFIPWLTDVAAPAVGNAAVEIGLALGRGIVLGLNSYLQQHMPEVLADLIAPPEGPQQAVKNLLGGGGGETYVPPTTGGTGLAGSQGPAPSDPRGGSFGMHDGGVVPGRPGQEQWRLLVAGETVVPTHKPGFSADSGPKIDIGNMNFYTQEAAPQAVQRRLRDLVYLYGGGF